MKIAVDKKLLQGKTAAGTTTLATNAAMNSIVRNEAGEGRQEHLRWLAEVEQKDKKVNNDAWESAQFEEAMADHCCLMKRRIIAELMSFIEVLRLILDVSRGYRD